ncbi:S-formylglutathione hydrolase [Sneathiella marina]|uniref:S-formylglutathione hydrolase n=1 Tax=Sneathiella marina TaxID=2950108 RepID=A0ABY4W759_9PROT|nr:S-formylglutathione hydrolase [Sneathiella marina]USG63015.1 S-formylglutathione hydrolase [Sneathiella marina]
MEIISEQKCFGGVQGFYQHASHSTGTNMRFAVFQPPQAKTGSVPLLFFLAGLTCTEETATIKAGMQQFAAKHGLMLVMPDTSPRGLDISGEDDDWDFGTGAGFYLDAIRLPWAKNYNMGSYVSNELRGFILNNFNARPDKAGISGHSMGGHGALTIGLKHPDIFQSVSAFAPICAPIQCPWGQKAFTGYLGEDKSLWREYDATELVRQHPTQNMILIDQGNEDGFLEEQLHPHLFETACNAAGQPLNLRFHEGYDHSYYFIQSFIEDHIEHHAAILNND